MTTTIVKNETGDARTQGDVDKMWDDKQSAVNELGAGRYVWHLKLKQIHLNLVNMQWKDFHQESVERNKISN